MLSGIFQSSFERGETLELRTRFLAFTTDTVALYSLGQTMGLQGDERRAQEWNQTIRAVAKLTPLVKQFPWSIDISSILPLGMAHLIMPDFARVLQFRQVSSTQPHISCEYCSQASISTMQMRKTTDVDFVFAGHALPRPPILDEISWQT